MLVLVPFGVSLAVAFVIGLPLSFVRSPHIVLRVCQWTLAVQAAIVVSAWMVITWLLNQSDSDASCLAFEGRHGDVLAVLAYASIPLGAGALAAGVLSVRRRVAGAGHVVLGLVAAALAWSVFLPFLYIAIGCALGN